MCIFIVKVKKICKYSDLANYVYVKYISAAWAKGVITNEINDWVGGCRR